MIFVKHSELEGTHAFLSPSNHAWVNYSNEKLAQVYLNLQAKERGTQLHEYADMAIRLGRRQPKSRETLCMYVNDAIGYGMHPEQPLFYSYNCYGTADSIVYRKNVLRIHDLKTGETKASMEQLYIYAALFCLEYGAYAEGLRKKGLNDIAIAEALKVRPEEVHFAPEKMDDIILRIYQFNDIKEDHPDPVVIRDLMNLIVEQDRVIQNLKAEETDHV